ncbi:MAG TPA: hypothetical protein VLL73_01515 [Desulfurivibrionaceae bacterium]|nr:hypothetical protein [Desulfurivibrionaceae bacterium]
MKTLSLIIGCTLIFLAAPALALIQPPAPSSETIHLHFAWPAGLKGSSTYQSTKRVNSGRGEKRETVSGTTTFTVKAAGEELIIHQQTPSITVQGSTPEQTATMQKLYDALGKVKLAFVVGQDGAYRRLDGLEELRSTLLHELELGFATTLQGMPVTDRKRVLDTLASALSTEQLETLIVAQWNREVAQWTDADLEPDVWYTLEFSSRVPMFNNADIPMSARFRTTGRVPCTAADKKISCVALEMQSHADPNAVGKQVADFVDKLAGKSLPITFENLQLTTTLRLVTDPSTLLPYEVIFTETSSVTVSADGTSQETRKFEESVYRYTYDR